METRSETDPNEVESLSFTEPQLRYEISRIVRFFMSIVKKRIWQPEFDEFLVLSEQNGL